MILTVHTASVKSSAIRIHLQLALRVVTEVDMHRSWPIRRPTNPFTSLFRRCNSTVFLFDDIPHVAQVKWKLLLQRFPFRNPSVDDQCIPLRDRNCVRQLFQPLYIFSTVTSIDRDYKSKLQKRITSNDSNSSSNIRRSYGVSWSM